MYNPPSCPRKYRKLMFIHGHSFTDGSSAWFTHRVFAARPELDGVAGRRLPRSASKPRGTKKGREHEREQDAPVGGRVVEHVLVGALFLELFVVPFVRHAPRGRRARRQAEDDRQRERERGKGTQPRCRSKYVAP